MGNRVKKINVSSNEFIVNVSAIGGITSEVKGIITAVKLYTNGLLFVEYSLVRGVLASRSARCNIHHIHDCLELVKNECYDFIFHFDCALIGGNATNSETN